MDTYKITIEAFLPDGFREDRVDDLIADVIDDLGGQVLDIKKYEYTGEHINNLYSYKIVVETLLEEDYNEVKIDTAIADMLFAIDGEVIDIKEYEKID